MRRSQGFPQEVTIAVDTEYYGPHTLTVQTACRLDAETVTVQVYRSPAIPDIPSEFDVADYVVPGDYDRHFQRLDLRPTKVITPDLSPSHFIHDLFPTGESSQALSRRDGLQLIEQFDDVVPLPENVVWNDRTDRWRIPAVHLMIVGHFLPADFFRLFGRKLLDGLLGHDLDKPGSLIIPGGKLLRFRSRGGSGYDARPVLQYLRLADGGFYEIRVSFFDTCLPFGTATLDRHSQTFLGTGKSDAISACEKANMLTTFHEKPADAFGYSVSDSVNTLLIHEEMQQKDRQIYAGFGFTTSESPPLRSTLGARVADFVTKTTAKAAVGSRQLRSTRALKNLMCRGGVRHLAENPRGSMYGPQTGGVHGGLLFSRSPTRFWHESDGMLRDVDMAACYNKVIAGMNMYWGEPVILEPGSQKLSLKEAVGIVRQHAPDDGWIIRASGEIEAAPNALVPSTPNAITASNYRRKRRGKAVTGKSVARVYSQQIDSGIVTNATWTMIEALPANLRTEYEYLEAESIMFFPINLIANDGPEYDKLVDRFSVGDLPWQSIVDLHNMQILRTEALDSGYVSLRYPIGQYGKSIGRLRREALAEDGKGSGMDVAWKLHANTMYGVLACPNMATNNIVAANVITATARAGAYALMQAMNGIQVITDGCSYRLDQIPACSFEECLRIKPDYPIRRAEKNSSIPFLKPSKTPSDDAEFTEWYGEHVRRFFGAMAPEFKRLIRNHRLEHKKTGLGQSIAFDALACDGSANYVKCSRGPDGDWQIEDIAMRGYGKQAKAYLQDWIIQTYANDQLTQPPPITEDRVLLKFKEAVQKARRALRSSASRVCVPLGFQDSRVGMYRAIKPSAFIFKTPAQRDAIIKQIKKFVQKIGCGLEVLALRRSYGGRRKGSLEDIAETIYELIQRGDHDLTKALNLTRGFDQLDAISAARQQDRALRKTIAANRLQSAVDANRMPAESQLTGWHVRNDAAPVRMGEDRTIVLPGTDDLPLSDGEPNAGRTVAK